MHEITRRTLLFSGAALPLLARKSSTKIGVTDWNLRMTGKVEAVALAKSLGFDGVEVSLGMKVAGDKLPLDNAELQAKYLAAFKESGIVPAGTCLDVLHRNYLKNDKLGAKWVADGIPITKKLGAKVMLLPFFGKGAIELPAEQDAVAAALKDIVKDAEKAGVTLGLENTISAEANVRIMEKVGSKALKVYYDVQNSTNAGFDIIKELKWLGGSRICQIHLKDNPHFLGEGKIDFKAVMATIAEIGYKGFMNLETDCPSKSVENDMKRNLAFIQAFGGAANKS